jgi:hypothetical protein
VRKGTQQIPQIYQESVKNDNIQLKSKWRKKGDFYYKSTTSPVKKGGAALQGQRSTTVTNMFLPKYILLIFEAVLTI